MSFRNFVYHFLQVDNYCGNCGKALDVIEGYQKISMWPQYSFFTWRWLTQTLFGDNKTMRFCMPHLKRSLWSRAFKRKFVPTTRDCFAEFSKNGRLMELQRA